MSGEFARLITPPELPDLEFMHARFDGQTFMPHSHSYLSITLILEGHWLSHHSGIPHTARKGQIG
ncbi:AraC family ligand binding domain-containing protein, partial [Gemmatimonadota bacterium]